MMRLLPSREFIRRVIAVLWIITCIWLLVRILLLRNAPPNVFWDAEELEQIYMFCLSAPLSGIILYFVSFMTKFDWWRYSANDARTILAVWLFFFALGCLNWFVLVPWVVHTGYDLFDFVVRVVRRRFGNHDAGSSTSED
jgi:hypothetical protein